MALADAVTTPNIDVALGAQDEAISPLAAQSEADSSSECAVALSAFIGAAVDATEPKVSYTSQDLHHAFSRLVGWWTRRGVPLERGVLLSEESINRFIADGLPDLSDASRGNVRAQLRRMRDVLHPQVLPAPEVLPPSAPSVPYSDAETDAFSQWADSQSTPDYSDDSDVILALGFGAGLTSAEMGSVRASDIASDDSGVLIAVTGPRPRVVPVRRRWEAVLVERAVQLKPADYVIRPLRKTNSKNLISNIVDRGVDPELGPSSQRMRATWLVHHMTAETSLPTLMEAAGIQSLEALTRYVRFVPKVSDEQARMQLRA
jgi:integrase